MDPHDLVPLLRRRGLIVVLALLMGGAGALLGLSHADKVYGTTVTFVLSSTTTQRPISPLMTDQAAADFETFDSLVLSPIVVERVLREAPYPLAGVGFSAVPNTIFARLTVRSATPVGAYKLASAYAAVLPAYISEFAPSQTSASTTLAVLEPPTASPARVAASRRSTLARGLAIGLLFGLCVAVALEGLDTRVHTGKLLAKHTGLPLLQTIPWENRREQLVLHRRPLSPRAEAIKQLRATLQRADTNRPQVLVVTSATAREGRTSVAGDLALAFAETGLRVALVDADLRHPQLARLFGSPGAPGLREFLANVAPHDSLAFLTPHPGLHVLPSGNHPANPASLLTPERIRPLVTSLRDRFDLVVFDSAPLLPVADTSALLAQADAALLISRLRFTTRRQAAAAGAQLRARQLPLVGVIANASKAANETMFAAGLNSSGQAQAAT